MTATPERASATRESAVREIELLTDGLERLYTDSLSLAKLELTQRARTLAGDLSQIGTFAALAGVGYGLLSVALAVALSASIGTAWAFVAVGSVNAVAGGAGLLFVSARMRAAP